MIKDCILPDTYRKDEGAKSTVVCAIGNRTSGTASYFRGRHPGQRGLAGVFLNLKCHENSYNRTEGPK